MISRSIVKLSIILSLIPILRSNTVLAQGDWSATLYINPYPSPYLSDWENNPTIGHAELTNNTDQTVQVRIFLTIERSGTGTIASGNSVFFDFPPGSSQNIYSTELVDYGSLDYNRDLEDTALRTGRLPEGEYRACIRLEDDIGTTLLDNVCAPFTILYPDPPYLTFPFDGDSITALYPVFQWTPVQTPPGFAIHYSILIVEIIQGQVPSQALAANIPQYEDDNISATSLQYPIDALPLEDGATYAWQVQALDENGYPVTSNDGKSEIWTFIFASGAGSGGEQQPSPPEGNIAIQITHISEALGIFQDLYNAPFDSVLEILSSMADSGALNIPIPIPDLEAFPDISIPNGFLQLSDSLFTIGGQSNIDNRQAEIQYDGRRGSENQANSYSFNISIPDNISFSDLIQLGRPYFPALGELPVNFDLGAPSIAVNMSGEDIGLGIDGDFEIGQLSGSADIAVRFSGEGPAFDFSLGSLPDNIEIADLTAAAESLLTGWQPSTGPATDWINSFDFNLSDLNLDLDFVPESTMVDISGAFDTGNLEGRAGFRYIKESEEESVSGYLSITLNNIQLQDAVAMADSLFPGYWSPPSGPAVDWVESLGLSFPQATLSLTFGDDHFGIGISGSFVTDQRSGTADLTFTQVGQQTSLSFNGAFDNDVSFTLNDALALFPSVQPTPFDMPWLESMTLNGPSLNLRLTPDSLVAGVSGAFTSGQRSGTAGLVYTQAGDNPVIKATVTFNQDASFALSDMVDLLPSSWPAPSGEVFDWLGNLGLNIPGITLEMILNSDCVNVSMFGPFTLAGQQGSARVGFDYCGGELAISGNINLITQEITFADALAMADSLLPGWSPPSGPVFDKIESLGFSFPSMTLDLSFTMDSLQVGLLGPFSFGGGGGNEQEGTSDIKLVRSEGSSSLLGGFNLNLSDIDLPAIMNTISNLLPDGWTLPSGPAIDRLQSLNLNFLQGASLGMNFNPSGLIDFDLFGPFHFDGGGGGGQEDNEGESNVELAQDDNGYHLGGSLDFTLPQIDLPGVMDLVSNILPDDWSPSSLPSIEWLQSFDFSFDHPTLDIAFPQNGFDINFNGPFRSGQGNGSRSGNAYFAYQYTGEENRFSGGLDFSIENIQFGGLISLADSLLGDRWSPPSGPVMDMIQSMDLSFPTASLSLGFSPDSFDVGIGGSFIIGGQQGSADLNLVRSGGETTVGGDLSLLLHDIDYPGIMAVADSLLPDSWNPPSGPAAQAIESLDLSFPEASLILSFSSDNFDISVAGSFVMGQRRGEVGIAFSTDNSGSSVTFTGSFGPNDMFSLADLTSMFSPGQMSQQLDWLQSIQISGPTLGIFASADSVRGSVSGNFVLNQKPGTAELAITTTSNMGMIAFTGAFNNGVTFSFSDILGLLPNDMSSLNPPVDINLISPRISVVITNESFRAGISGNLNIAGQTGSASLAFSYDDGGPSLVFTGTVDHFSANNMIDFIQNQTGVSNFADNLPEDMLDFNNLIITIGVGSDSRFSIAANSSFMGQQTDLLISVIRHSGHPPTPVIGIRPTRWSLSEAFPELSSPIIDELDLSTLGFVFSSSSDTLESSDLSPQERQFYGGIRGSDDFSLKLNSGVMLMGTILPSSFNPDGPMAKILNLLGGGDQGLYLEGSLPLGFGHGGGGLDGLSLSLSLPPMSPPNPPDWFESGTLAVEISGSPIGVSLVGSITVDIDEQALTFFVAGAITIAGPNVSFTISGGLSTDEPWEQPFGIQWLVFNRAMVMVGINAVGNISLGFRADMVIGEKDMDVAVLVSVNASGVPTNFMLDGESEAGFGMTDIAKLQHNMAVAKAQEDGQPPPPMLPLELLPTMDIKNCRLKFAPRDEPALDITKGMAIAGELYIAVQHDQEPQDFAGIDMSVEDMRIHASGHLAAFTLGPIIWDDGLFDMNLELGATHLIIDGQAQFLDNSQQVTVNMSRDSLFFNTSTQIDNRFSADLTGKGMLNLTNPSMEVHGVMQSDFNDQYAQLLSDGIAGFANASDQAINAALDAYSQVSALHEHKQQAIDSLTALLNNIRAAAENAMNEAQATRDQAQAEKSSALSQKNSAYSAWQNTPRRQVALRAQRYATYVTKAGIYATKAAVYATRQAAFLAKQAAHNAIPSPDTDPVLVALREQSDQLWAEMENRMNDLQHLQTFVQGIIDYMNQQGGPLVTIQGAQFDAALSALSQGGDVHLAADLTLAGEPRHLDVNINLQDEASALPQIINSLVGTI